MGRRCRQRLGTAYADPLKWALDSFRGIDPVYVHAYALAREFAALTLNEPADMPARYDTSHSAIIAITARIAKRPHMPRERSPSRSNTTAEK